MDLRVWVFFAAAEVFAEDAFLVLFFLSGRTTVMTFPTLPSAASVSSLSLAEARFFLRVGQSMLMHSFTFPIWIMGAPHSGQASPVGVMVPLGLRG